jgi:peptidoglycan hydrolase-like protein with peptidoglycan-binding domain
MSGSPRDLAVPDPWEASLARSRARREKTVGGNSPVRLGKLIEARNMVQARNTDISDTRVMSEGCTPLDARKRLPSSRNLADSEPWHLSTLRSRTRRRAAELQFVPTTTRARRVSLGTLLAIAAGPAAGLADANGSPHATAPAPEPPTTTKHHIQLQSGSEGRQVSMLQHALGIAVDGKFGPQTDAAVRAFQARHHLSVNGVVGPETSAAINGGSASVGRTVATTRVGKNENAKHTVSPVARLQAALGVEVDGTFGPETEKAVRRLQASRHLHVDGVVGGETWRALGISEHVTLHPPKASSRRVHGGIEHSRSHASTHASVRASSPASRTDAVKRLQEALHVEADGNFGAETEAAVKRMQAHHGLSVDGVVGPETWSALGINSHTTLHPPRSHKSGSSSAGGGSSSVISRVIAAADEIATRPYVYGGGHGSFQSVGYDCSGSVSYALHGGGLLSSPEDSSALETYGEAGPGRHITIYANSGHAWMVIDGRRFDTVAQQEGGSRWSDSMTSTSGYVVRHPAGF